jgi:hypothetical protein
MTSLVGLVVLVACTSQERQSALPTPTPIELSFSLRGTVHDSAGRPVGQAKVEVLDRWQTATVTLTDDSGQFSFADTFATELVVRASASGYVAQSKAFSAQEAIAGRDAWFRLESTTRPVNLTGSYRLTFEADRACTMLPPAARSRIYSTTISSNASFYLLRLRDAVFAQPAGYPGLNGNVLYVSLFEDYAWWGFSDPPIVEQLSGESYLVVDGYADGTITGPTTALRLWGTFAFCGARESGGNGCAVPEAECRSTRHTLTLSRD